ncbi:MAG: MauE/DoxX family redox-associated membrane protein, partial [Candidatus Dormiibacterota bacterium]
VFGMSAASKVRTRYDFDAFVASTAALTRLHRPAALRAAAVAVAAEVSVFILLLLPTPTTGLLGFAVAAVLLTGFTVGMTASLRQPNTVPCRCFGSGTMPIRIPDVARNLILLSLAGLGAVNAAPHLASVPPASLIESLFMAAVVAWLLIHFADVAWLFGSSPLSVPGVRQRQPPQ